MASAPQAQGLPILYNGLQPLSSVEHATWKVRKLDNVNLIANIHALPLTAEEIGVAQRYFPIVFSIGPDPVPLALMGLNANVNVFVDENGQFTPNTYMPAYVRRYPFLLVKLRQESDDLSLCFDPSADLLGDFEEGTPLFEDGQPTKQVTDTVAFCEQFEIAAQSTTQFMKDLAELDLLEDGEFTIQPEGAPQPYVYRGFQVVNEEKLRDLRGDQLRKISKNGMLGLLYAHLFSLTLITDIFNRQMEQGKLPPQSQVAPI